MLALRLASNGLEAYRVAQRKGYEGVVAKDASSPYIEGSSTKWAKCKVHQEEEFVIGGYTAPYLLVRANISARSSLGRTTITNSCGM